MKSKRMLGAIITIILIIIGIYFLFKNIEIKKIENEYQDYIPQFIEKYNNSDIQKKVALNIDKFIKGINDKNYNYSYSVLADSFKKNKYPTIISFESDMKNQIIDNCSVEYSVFSQQGSNYSYRITLKSGEESKSMNVIMKLGDGTNFEMSFSFE